MAISVHHTTNYVNFGVVKWAEDIWGVGGEVDKSRWIKQFQVGLFVYFHKLK